MKQLTSARLLRLIYMYRYFIIYHYICDDISESHYFEAHNYAMSYIYI